MVNRKAKGVRMSVDFGEDVEVDNRAHLDSFQEMAEEVNDNHFGTDPLLVLTANHFVQELILQAQVEAKRRLMTDHEDADWISEHEGPNEGEVRRSLLS